MSDTVHYRICPRRPEAHLFEVELTIPAPQPQQVVSLPAWIPGSYMIRDFAKNIVTLEGHDATGPITVTKQDKQTWICAAGEGPLTLRYQVYAWDLSVRSAHLDTSHGYFNGTSVFLRVHGRENAPCTVELLAPEGDDYGPWRVATTLPRDGAEPYGFGAYRAADYDELIDHPVEMGTFTLMQFEAGGIAHEMALTGQHYADTDRLAADLKRICEYHISLFGTLPTERYLFQTMVVGEGYGGLEHRSSCSLVCSRGDLPLPGQAQAQATERYRNFLGLCSHEYFHTWNVKRIKPAAFQPYDLSQEVHTPLLWAFEGITSYYDDLGLVRAGLITPDEYLAVVGKNITRVLRSPGRFKQSVSESSFDAWTKFYKQDENAPNAIVSYYIKGALIALGLDLKIRAESTGARSLDDVMRALWERHGKPGVGVSEQGIEQLIEEVAGVEVTTYLEQALRGTADLPMEELLRPFGVELHLRRAESLSDSGGTPAKEPDRARTSMGIRTGSDPLGARLLNVFEGGAAQAAGLSGGDVIVAIDGLRTTHETMDERLSPFQPGDSVPVHAFRRDELKRFEVALTDAPADTCYLQFAETSSASAESLRRAWLGS